MTHPGTIISVNKKSVTVQIESVSACVACQAHSRCGFAESKTKTLDIPLSCVSPDLRATLQPSDLPPQTPVLVTIDTTHGLLAVLIAYLLPAILLLGVVIGLSLAGLPEWAVILLSLASLALYILLLVLFRQRIDNHFTLKVEKPTLNS